MGQIARSKPATLRLAVGVAILVLEYLVLGVSFDGTRLTEVKGWWSALGNVSNLVAIGLLVITSGLLVRWRSIFDGLFGETPDFGKPKWAWLGLHVLGFGTFSAICAYLFAGAKLDSQRALAVTVVWPIAALAAGCGLFRFLAGDAWRGAAAELWRTLRAGTLIGLPAWWLAWMTRPYWPWFLARTLPQAGAMLHWVAPAATIDEAGSILSLDDFSVRVAPECSGVEGLVVVAVFLLGYLALSYRQLRFPNALLLLPLGLATVWQMNATRIALLVLIGARLSPGVALGGFHSKAGWISVCAVALAFIAVSRRMGFFMRQVETAENTENPTAVYCLPLFAMTATGLVTGLLAADGMDWLYGVRVLVIGVVFWFYRRKYREIVNFGSLWAVLNGVIVFAFWFALVRLHAAPGVATALGEQVAGADPAPRWLWLASRVVGSVIATPIAEELAFRGFLQRRLIANDFQEVPQRAFTPLSLAGSALAFGLVHANWIAGVLAAVAFSLATYKRGRLGDAIVAHATANALIAVAVIGFGQWWLW